MTNLKSGKKRIIFTVTNDLTYDRRMMRICTTIATAGYDVTLVGRKLKSSQSFENQYFKHKQFSLFFNKGKFFYLEYNVRLFFWLLFQGFDIVAPVDLDTILPAYFASILRGQKPCVFDAHELFTEVPEVIRRPKIRKIWLTVERFVVPKLTHCYTVSQSVADELEQRYGVKFEVIRNLPNRQNPISNISNLTSKILLYQGNLNEGRGLETAVRAMQFVENAVFWVVGDGEMMPILRGLVAELGLENKVKFWGFVKPDDLPKMTEQATIGLHISEDMGLSYRYSLGNKFLDYIQAGVPQICTQFIEYQRLNDEFEVAILIEKTDVELLVSAINRLLNDAVLYEKMRANCLKAAAELCWEMEERKLVEFYGRV